MDLKLPLIVSRQGGRLLSCWLPHWPDAACLGSELDWVEPHHNNPTQVGEMLLTCRDCPVKLECREWATEHGEYGIWGATLDRDRADIRRARRVSV